jgi:hypothetical protein
MLLILNYPSVYILLFAIDLELAILDIFSDKLFKEEAANLCCENPDS